jgi:hypothetical protein
MWYSNAQDRKCGKVMLGTGNVVQYYWGQEMWYRTVGDRKCGRVMLGMGNVVQ